MSFIPQVGQQVYSIHYGSVGHVQYNLFTVKSVSKTGRDVVVGREGSEYTYKFRRVGESDQYFEVGKDRYRADTLNFDIKEVKAIIDRKNKMKRIAAKLNEIKNLEVMRDSYGEESMLRRIVQIEGLLAEAKEMIEK